MNNLRSFDPDLDNFLLEEPTPPKENNLAVIVCAFFVGSILVFLSILSLYFVHKNASWSWDEYSTQPYPITGQYSSIASVESTWVVQSNTTTEEGLSDNSYYPITTITLENNAQSGKLRCYYLNSEGKYTGDPVTQSFSNGTFNSEPQLSFQCSKGIDSRSDFNAYNSGYLKPWYLVILEGAHESITMSDYRELAKIPIHAELPQLLTN